ncbi:MAG: hypothetical protein AB9M60_19335, partial [Leptothrix sp. (in: b-proteobacteria)]
MTDAWSELVSGMASSFGSLPAPAPGARRAGVRSSGLALRARMAVRVCAQALQVERPADWRCWLRRLVLLPDPAARRRPGATDSASPTAPIAPMGTS